VVSNCRSVYDLRKVLLCKDILILSDKNLTILCCRKKYLFLSRICFTYKFVIPNIYIYIYLKFLKYWSNSCNFNKLVIKAKMHAKTYFWSFLCCMKIHFDFLALRDLVVCMKQKYIFLWKTGYFNTRFVSFTV
jgi:hypothetical protein